MNRGLTLTERLLSHCDVSEAAQGPGSWEVGRLVLAEDYRTDPSILKQCLFLALSYLCNHAHAPDLYASCTHVLGRLYRRFGFNILANDVLLEATQKKYTLIRGCAPTVLRTLGGTQAQAQMVTH